MGAVIDHVVYGVRDVAAAGERLAGLGLASYFGGSHPALGTSNRIVPLGQSYLEVIGPAPFAEDRFVAWMVRGAPMGPDAVPMHRVREDGSVVSWRLDGLTAPSLWEMDGLVPVRIEWDADVELPGLAQPPIGELAAVEFSVSGIVAVRVRLHDGAVIELR